MGDRSLTLKIEEEPLTRLEALAREAGRSGGAGRGSVQRHVEDESWKADKIRNAVRRADTGDFATDEEMDAVFDRYPQAADTSR